MIDPKILIIPDIHGRDFYKEAVSEAVCSDIEIVCLGDYLDPYWWDELHEDGVFEPLKELVRVKKSRPDKTHLLIGNHDSSYFYRREMCRTRYDIDNAPIYRYYFRKNSMLFDLFYDTVIAEKRFLFSHAGVTKRWLSNIKSSAESIDDKLTWLKEHFNEFRNDFTRTAIWEHLSQIGEERGGRDDSGSIIWADFFEHTDKKNWIDDDNIIQIVGHTQLNSHPARIDNRLYCLDCRSPFYVDNKGVIRSWGTDENIMIKYNILEK